MLGLVGYVLVAPTLQSRPVPPHPWGLWVSTDAHDERSYPRPTSWLLKLWIEAEGGCGQPVTARGELYVAKPSHLTRSPRLAVLSVVGAHLLGAEVKGIPGLRSLVGYRWRPMTVSRFQGASVAHAPLRGRLEPRLLSARVLLFRLSLDATRGAGYAACSMTSPALFGLPGDNAVGDLASLSGEAFLRKRARLAYAPLTDAIVHMSVPGRIPDRSELDANAIVHGDSLLLTCDDGFVHHLSPAAREDEYFYMRTLAVEPSCASVQSFRASDAVESLSLRLFLAGVLLGAAVTILLEALAIGRTEPAR
jgi:hypothetical protein